LVAILSGGSRGSASSTTVTRSTDLGTGTTTVTRDTDVV
jgi:hypothetical protein